jgi:uncharacterized protein YdeI (YjbR/CyaY-like superfamily)
MAARAKRAARPTASMPEPTFFATPAALRAWFAKHHATAKELWVGFHKRATGTPSITWPESVDEALCVGWIDGVRRSLGEASYVIRFTPRRPTSRWSLVNVRRVKALAKEGRMRPAGRAAFALADEKKTGTYSYEREHASFTRAQLAALRRNAAAWRFWNAQPPWYRRVATHWVTSAKREETRARRLATLIAGSAAGHRIGILRLPERPPKARTAR